MATSDPSPRSEIRGREATVSMEYRDARALVSVWTGDRAGATVEAARLACEAVHQARVRHAHRVVVALEVATPACTVILEALRRREGNDVARIAMRRAGSTVMVTLDLRPWPTVPGPSADGRGAVVPTQPVGEGLRPDRAPGTVPVSALPTTLPATTLAAGAALTPA